MNKTDNVIFHLDPRLKKHPIFYIYCHFFALHELFTSFVFPIFKDLAADKKGTPTLPQSFNGEVADVKKVISTL